MHVQLIRAAAAMILLLGTLAGAGGVAGQTLAAVVVHGAGFATPRLIADAELANCMWGFTYNLYAEPSESPPAPDAKAVTLSFFNDEEWAGVNPGLPSVDPEKAKFHTRIILSPATGTEMPHVQYKKPLNSTFVDRMRLMASAEAFFAWHGIPTRVDSLGAPRVRSFSEAELANAQRELHGIFGSRMPVCASIGR